MKKCKVDKCVAKARIRGRYDGFCKRHAKQLFVHGKIRQDIGRSRRDPNIFKVKGPVCEIVMFDNAGMESLRAIIDTEDLLKVRDYKWCNSKGYVFNAKNKIYLHNIIFNFDPKKQRFTNRGVVEIDHINNDPLDNRKINLRIGTNRQNMMNRGAAKNSRTGIKGVSWCKVKKRWRVAISSDCKYRHIGYYDEIDEAKEAYIFASKRFHGEFAHGLS